MTPEEQVYEEHQREPIFFAWTRSFWLGIFPALLTALDLAFTMIQNSETAAPIAGVIAVMLSTVLYPTGVVLTQEEVHATMIALAPFYALIVGHQRSHAARPYTMDPRAIK